MTPEQVAEILLVQAAEETQSAALAPEARIDALEAAGDLDDERAWFARRARHLLAHELAGYRPLLRVRLQRGCEETVRGHGFVGRGAAEAVTELAFPFEDIGRPHLQEAIGEARFEDAASHDAKRAGALAHVVTFPDLLPAAALEDPERLRLLR